MERHATVIIFLMQRAGKRIDEEAHDFECDAFVFTQNVERRLSMRISSTGSAGEIFEKTSNYANCNSFIAARFTKEIISLAVSLNYFA
jgi:hypothetical protein